MIPSTNSAGQGLEIVTIASVATPLIDDRSLADATARIAAGDAAAVRVAREGSLGGDVLVVDSSVLRHIPAELLDDISGAGRLADPVTAMVDLQWRLELFGHRVLTMGDPSVGPAHGSLHVSRRIAAALNVLHTNLGAELQGPVTAAAQLYVTTRAFSRAGVDTSALDLQRSPGGDEVGGIAIPAGALGGAFALDVALDDLAAVSEVRTEVQSHRRVPERALAPGLLDVVRTLLDVESTEDREQLDRILELMGVRRLLDEPLHVLIAFSAPSTQRAELLMTRIGETSRVRVLRTESGEVTEQGLPVPGAVDGHAEWADVVVLMSATLNDLPGVEHSEVPLVVDLTLLDVAGWLLSPASSYRSEALRVLMGRADLVLAADAGQRDLLLGALAGQGRVNPTVYDDDPTLLSLVRVDTSGESLAAYCRFPVRAADSTEPPPELPQKVSDLTKAVGFLREGGTSMLLQRAAGRVRRLFHDRRISR